MEALADTIGLRALGIGAAVIDRLQVQIFDLAIGPILEVRKFGLLREISANAVSPQVSYNSDRAA